VAISPNGKLFVTSGPYDSISVFDTTRNNAPLPPITGGYLTDPVGTVVR
jgi:DNA-binding beta-propeller fold protein YncE